MVTCTRYWLSLRCYIRYASFSEVKVLSHLKCAMPLAHAKHLVVTVPPITEQGIIDAARVEVDITLRIMLCT